MFPYPTRCRTGGARARSGVSPAHGFWFLRGGRSGPMAGDLLVVWHPAPKSIARLRDAVLAGSADADDPFPVRSLAAPNAGADDVEAAAATVIITTENFGAVAGLGQDFPDDRKRGGEGTRGSGPVDMGGRPTSQKKKK